ncbi:MAG: methylmalonyl-CoA epimerase [Ignavibacteria bacterium]
MITKIAHIGIAVKDLNASKEIYKKMFQSEPSDVEYIAEQKVNVVKFKVGESTIELLEGTSPDSPITKFIDKKGEGIHHISYESDNITEDMKRLNNEGFELIYKEPKTGSDNSLIAFLHPSSTIGVLTELSQHKLP